MGCATVEVSPRVAKIPKPREGVYHKVKKGETLWRIAKTYAVDVEDIVMSNRIPNVAFIETGQLIFVPGAKELRDVYTDLKDMDPEAFRWPLKGEVISYFGQRMALGKNQGIDIRARPQEVVTASRAGKVVFADELSGYAKTVIVDHYDGYYSVYANNERLLVDVNQKIEKGFPLGELAQESSKAKLHFEIRKGGYPDNPLYYLP